MPHMFSNMTYLGLIPYRKEDTKKEKVSEH